MLRRRASSVVAAWVVCACNRTTEPAGEQAPAEAGAPTFVRDVAPILDRSCAPCHFDGGPAPFALIDYDDVRDHASQIVEVTQSRFMPPWLPEAGSARYVGERRLSDEEIATLAAWVTAGREQGDPAQRPTPPVHDDGWRLGPPDVVLEMPAPFVLPADGTDVYRNFVIEVPPAAEGWIKAVELQPGNPKVAHHAVLRVDRTGDARKRDADDPAPGFSGMDFAGALMPDGRFVGWTPGKAPDPGQVARSFRLVGGSDIVLQVHLRPSGKPEPIRARIGLHLAERPASRRALAMQLSSTAIDLPPGAKDVHVRDRYRLPVDAYVITVYPHAHYLGKTLHGWAELPDGSRKWLAKIENWNFDWQDQYRFAEPVQLPAGTVIAMDYAFDNSAENPHNPSSPPVHVRFGSSSTDEMAELILEIEPADPSELAKLDADFMKAWLERQLRYFDDQLARDPNDVTTIVAIAALEARRGRKDEAIARYRDALVREPARHATRIDLGIVLMDAERWDEARTELERAVADAPDDMRAHLTLGNLLRKRRSLPAAIEQLRRATELDARSTEAWNNLGITLEHDRQLPAAEQALRRALELAPQRTLLHENLARVLAAQGKDADALASYRTALELDENATGAMVGMARLLLRDAEEGSSNALRAADLATRAVTLTGGRDIMTLELQATAFHAAGRLDRAHETATAALALARQTGDAAAIDRLQTKLDELRALAR